MLQTNFLFNIKNIEIPRAMEGAERPEISVKKFCIAAEIGDVWGRL